MLRSLLTLLTFSWSIATFAQSFKPGTQASSSMTENKGSTNVDHATGILNYSLPLTSISQSGFEVPISLFYAAKGIKKEQKATSVGLGFGLEAGGEVIRVVRGGKADEQYGHFQHPFDPADPSHIIELNDGQLDGESDLFIASFNSRTVKFLIERNELYMPVAIPLEQTNVKIECSREGNDFSRFKITDENGTVYSFHDPEYVSGLNAQQDISISDITLEPYVSSWHLSEIIIPNGDSIMFDYVKALNSEINSHYNNSLFVYGTPMTEPDLQNPQFLNLYYPALAQLDGVANFNQYNESENLIRELIRQIEFSTRNIPQDTWQEKLRRIIFLGMIIPSDPIIDGNMEVLQSELNVAYYNQMNNLDLFRQTKSNVASAIRQMYQNPRVVTSKISQTVSNSATTPWLIKSVRGKEGTITFNYEGYYSLLKSIEKRNRYGQSISSIRFDYNDQYTINSTLKSLTFLGEKNNSDSVNYSFDYYERFSTQGEDYWGFNSTKLNSSSNIPNNNTIVQGLWNDGPYTLPNDITTEFSPGSPYVYADRNPDLTGTLSNMLKEVRSPAGGKLVFDFELNEVAKRYSTPTPPNVPAGGLRIKEIKELDQNGNQVSKTTYKYNFPGESSGVFVTDKSSGVLVSTNQVSLGETIEYPQFSDFVLKSELPEALGHFGEVGNNGVFYSYAEELHEGNGKIGYRYLSFKDDDTSINAGNYLNVFAYYPYWLEHLLIATCYYTESGQLVKLERNKYAIAESDLALVTERPLNALTTIGARPFNNQLLQYKRNLYALPSSTSENFHDISVNVGLPGDAAAFYPSNYYYYPIDFYVGYNSYVEYYLPNLLPRMNPLVKYKKYIIFSGGKVLPAESETVTFGHPVGTADLTQAGLPTYTSGEYLYETLAKFSGAKPVVENTKLYYENPLHSMATRIESTDSRGRITTVKKKYPQDYILPAGDPVSMLTAQNILSSPVEVQHWMREGSSSADKLVSAELTEYAAYAGLPGKPALALPVKKYVVSEDAPVAVGTTLTQSPAALPPFSSLFHENHALYKLDQSMDWTLYGSSYQMTKVKAEHSALPVSYVWDKERKIVLLEASAAPGEIAAFDKMNGISEALNPNLPIYYYSDPLSKRFLYGGMDLDHYTIAENVLGLLADLKKEQPDKYEQMKQEPVFNQLEEMYKMAITEKNPVALRTFLDPKIDSIQNAYSRLDALTTLNGNYINFQGIYNGILDIERLTQNPEFQNKFVTRNYRTGYVRESLNDDGNTIYLSINAISTMNRDGKFSAIASFMDPPSGETGFYYTVSYSDRPSVSGYCAPNSLIRSGNILKAEIDLSGQPGKQNITGLSVGVPQGSSFVNMILCPSGVNFKASSYTTNNQLISEFGPDLHPVYYTYDGMGRVSSVKDQYGNIIKKSQYHFKPTAQSN